MTERTDYQANQPRGRFVTDPKVRAWIYGISLALLPLLIAYGILDENSAPLWAALIGAVLVPGLAVVNTPLGKGGYASGQSTPTNRQ